MKPITAAEINAVHDRCEREGVNLADDEAMRRTLDDIMAPSMRGLPAKHVCPVVYAELMIMLMMGVTIGACVIEQREVGGKT